MILSLLFTGRQDPLGPPWPPWCLANAAEEVLELASRLGVSSHVLRSANLEADSLAKEGVGRSSLFVVSPLPF